MVTKKPVTAAFLAALSQEVQPFLRRVRATCLPGAEPPAWEFTRGPHKGVTVVSGMGEDAAARSVAWVFERYQPQGLISLGFGGAVTPELTPGAVVLGETYWRYDPDTQTLEELPAPAWPHWSAALVERLRTAGLPVFRGSMITTRGIIHKAGHAALLHHLPHPVLDLETSAAALAAQVRTLPFLALRAITDVAAEEIPDFLKEAARQGQTPSGAAALAWLAADPRRLAVLLRLWGRSRLAAKHLTQALDAVLEVW
jgi:adenosylhomocysteine nucleosidase